jgi:hypothetical protein
MDWVKSIESGEYLKWIEVNYKKRAAKTDSSGWENHLLNK